MKLKYTFSVKLVNKHTKIVKVDANYYAEAVEKAWHKLNKAKKHLCDPDSLMLLKAVPPHKKRKKGKYPWGEGATNQFNSDHKILRKALLK